MKLYVIISNIYEPKGGLYKYASEPEKSPYLLTYQRSEREEFIEKWKYVLNGEVYFDAPKCFFIDFESVQITEITNKLTEIENSI